MEARDVKERMQPLAGEKKGTKYPTTFLSSFHHYLFMLLTTSTASFALFQVYTNRGSFGAQGRVENGRIDLWRQTELSTHPLRFCSQPISWPAFSSNEG